jgi:UDP-N-acetylmuramoyl-L-alanyl-D-glutamate--2,6-diaminopimelate ligase
MYPWQAENILAALGLAIGAGMKPNQAIEGLATLRGVSGRMEFIGQTVAGGLVFVDYAHKPHALESVLKHARAHTVGTLGKVVVVFGCGGDRDKTKRKMMGQIAAQWADDVIVTDDNPRQEEAARIRAEILEGCAAACEISSRREAISQAIRRLKAGDVCIIAGKGHEREQIVGDTVLPFNDADVVRELLKSQKENRREGETQRETPEGKKGKKAA